MYVADPCFHVKLLILSSIMSVLYTYILLVRVDFSGLWKVIWASLILSYWCWVVLCQIFVQIFSWQKWIFQDYGKSFDHSFTLVFHFCNSFSQLIVLLVQHWLKIGFFPLQCVVPASQELYSQCHNIDTHRLQSRQIYLPEVVTKGKWSRLLYFWGGWVFLFFNAEQTAAVDNSGWTCWQQ